MNSGEGLEIISSVKGRLGVVFVNLLELVWYWWKMSHGRHMGIFNSGILCRTCDSAGLWSLSAIWIIVSRK